MFFDSWTGVGRVLVVGTLAYVALIVLLRASGKRTLSKMNAFDFIVTIALGSTLATVLLSKDIALVEGLVAFALLIYLQFAVTWLSVRAKPVGRLVKSEPALLFFKGEFLSHAMKRERVTRAEAESAVRQHGDASLAAVLAIVLETDGSMSVIQRGDDDGRQLPGVVPPPRSAGSGAESD
jgi:uncharacterized membrane protein YcaP (DUF421 family)